jgi:hypothetical protein
VVSRSISAGLPARVCSVQEVSLAVMFTMLALNRNDAHSVGAIEPKATSLSLDRFSAVTSFLDLPQEVLVVIYGYVFDDLVLKLPTASRPFDRSPAALLAVCKSQHWAVREVLWAKATLSITSNEEMAKLTCHIPTIPPIQRLHMGSLTICAPFLLLSKLFRSLPALKTVQIDAGVESAENLGRNLLPSIDPNLDLGQFSAPMVNTIGVTLEDLLFGTWGLCYYYGVGDDDRTKMHNTWIEEVLFNNTSSNAPQVTLNFAVDSNDENDPLRAMDLLPLRTTYDRESDALHFSYKGKKYQAKQRHDTSCPLDPDALAFFDHNEDLDAKRWS